jgi:hypothetical protein
VPGCGAWLFYCFFEGGVKWGWCQEQISHIVPGTKQSICAWHRPFFTVKRRKMERFVECSTRLIKNLERMIQWEENLEFGIRVLFTILQQEGIEKIISSGTARITTTIYPYF